MSLSLLIACAGDEQESEICSKGVVCAPGWRCTHNGKGCRAANSLCGNGIVDRNDKDVGTIALAGAGSDEMCDDGNVVDQDKCSADCGSDYTCGNGKIDGIVVPGRVDRVDYVLPADDPRIEVCDEGDLNGQPGHCGVDCKSNGKCGNRILDYEEECDYCLEYFKLLSSGVAGAGGASGVAVGFAGAAGDGGVAGASAEITACPVDKTPNCNGNCHYSKCGDGYVNEVAGETCEVKDGLDTANCNGRAAPPAVACHASKCGDGYVNTVAGETCDGSGGIDTSACNGASAPDGIACHVPICGDGYTNSGAGEQCDVGGGDSAGCNGTAAGASLQCRTSTCGDSYKNVASGEDCDDGTNGSSTCNGTAADALKCKTSLCGDGYVNRAAGEECDPLSGGDSGECNGTLAGPLLQCMKSTCGDGYVNTAAGEECDGGINGSPMCNGAVAGLSLQCKTTTCGDGYANAAAGEQCDVAGGIDSPTCNGTNANPLLRCKRPVCGDGYVNSASGEQCDEGGVDSPTCNGTSAGLQLQCKKARCGDNHVNSAADETCDDSNGRDAADCNGKEGPAGVACHEVRCGDNYPNRAAGEECDGSNGDDTPTCNGTNAGEKLQCKERICGDGYINKAEASEECDLGPKSGYGCDSSCKPKPGFTCTSPMGFGPSMCGATACGDGITAEGVEVCDDGNKDVCGTCGQGCTKDQTPKAATGSIKAIGWRYFNVGETLTISDGVHDAVTFEFNESGTDGPGHVYIRLGSSDHEGMRDKIIGAINRTDLTLDVTAHVGGSRTVSLYNESPGAGRRNVGITETVANSWFEVSGMSDGFGFDCENGRECTAHQDCYSEFCLITGASAPRGTCQDPSCGDGEKNGAELDTDCGTAAGCPACPGEECDDTHPCKDQNKPCPDADAGVVPRICP